MRGLRYTIKFCGLALCLFTGSCKKSGGNGAAGLPAETQTGKGTFGCMINGKLFVPKGGGLATCYYQHIYAGADGYFFHVSGQDNSDGDNIKNININCDSLKIVENKTYPLTNVLKGNAAGAYMIVSSFTTPATTTYSTTTAVNGAITIKKFDATLHIAAGTFWFNAVSSKGDTVKVTDGRFDMLYSQ